MTRPRQAHNRVYTLWTSFREAITDTDWPADIWTQILATDTAMSRLSLALLHQAQAEELADSGEIDTLLRPAHLQLAYARAGRPRRTDSP